ncbi:hypothetical protein ACLESD_43160, partial [Pyxidicoccus sp. 3LFB2]
PAGRRLLGRGRGSCPARVCAPNITSDPEHGIGRWTDEELVRALRDGTGRDGKTLFPLMPFLLYRELSDADTRAVIAFLRQVPPAKGSMTRSDIPQEVYAQYQSLAAPMKAAVAEPAQDAVSRGRYLATVAQCAACHAGVDEAGTPFAGGRSPAHAPGPRGGPQRDAPRQGVGCPGRGGLRRALRRLQGRGPGSGQGRPGQQAVHALGLLRRAVRGRPEGAVPLPAHRPRSRTRRVSRPGTHWRVTPSGVKRKWPVDCPPSP